MEAEAELTTAKAALANFVLAHGEEVPAEMLPFANLSISDIAHAAWLCGYHPGDDPREVFKRAATRASEWQNIEAHLADRMSRLDVAAGDGRTLTLLDAVKGLLLGEAQDQDNHIVLTVARACLPEGDIGTGDANGQPFYFHALEQTYGPRYARPEQAVQMAWKAHMEGVAARAAKAESELQNLAAEVGLRTSDGEVGLRHDTAYFYSGRWARLCKALGLDPNTEPHPSEVQAVARAALDRNVLDEVRGLGEATERVDKVAEPFDVRTTLERIAGDTSVDAPTRVRACEALRGFGPPKPPQRARDLEWFTALYGRIIDPPKLHSDLTGVRLVRSVGHGETVARQLYEKVKARAEAAEAKLYGGSPLAMPKRIAELERRLTHDPQGVRVEALASGHLSVWRISATADSRILWRSEVAATEDCALAIGRAVAWELFPDGYPEERVRQGIWWGPACSAFHEVVVRPAFDSSGNNVIEVHGELPNDLQADIQQVVRDRPDIIVATANGGTIKGPVIAYVKRNAVWFLTIPAR